MIDSRLEGGRQKSSLHVNFDRFIHLYFSVLIIVLFIDGYATENLGFDRLETMYFLGLVVLLLVRTLLIPPKLLSVWYLLGFVFLLISTFFFTWFDIVKLVDDFRLFARSVLIATLVYGFYQSSNSIGIKDFQRSIVLYWFCITFFILLHYWYGFGGVTRGTGIGLKPVIGSFFQGGNEIAFILVICWFYLFTMMKSSLIRVVVTAFTVGVAFLLSSKAAVVALFALLGGYLLWHLGRGSLVRRVLFRILVVIMCILALVFNTDIAYAILTVTMDFSLGEETLFSKLRKFDLLTLFLAGRDLKAAAMIDAMNDGGVIVWLFGLGSSFEIDGRYMVEIDILDVLKSFGLLGMLAYYIPIIWVLMKVWASDFLRLQVFRFYVFILGAGLATIMFSMSTGHILTSPAPMLILAMVFGVAGSRRCREELSKRENREHNTPYKETLRDKGNELNDKTIF